jgi:hypothetical protein
MLNFFNRIRIHINKQNLSFIDKKEMVPLFDSYAKWILLVAVVSRVLLAALAVMFSIRTENGSLVSPLIEVKFGDYDFYSWFIYDNFSALKKPFIFFYQGGSFDSWLTQHYAPGPVFPWLLNILNYSNQPILLASVYLIASALLIFGWVLYYRARGVSLWGQLALIAYPLLLWYSLAISTELPMSIALFMFFFGALATPRWPFMGIACAFTGFVLMLLIRPNALSLFPVMLFVLFLNRKLISNWNVSVIVVFITLIVAYFCVYYASYFLMVKDSSIRLISYWGLFPPQYFEGLFPNLPQLLDKIISNGALIGSKLLYASGLRPSYADPPILMVFLRSIPGIFIFPGIFYCFYRGSWLERALLLGFLLPLLITVAQERYLLPIAPLLLLYGGIFWKDFYHLLRKQLCS